MSSEFQGICGHQDNCNQKTFLYNIYLFGGEGGIVHEVKLFRSWINYLALIDQMCGIVWEPSVGIMTSLSTLVTDEEMIVSDRLENQILLESITNHDKWFSINQSSLQIC